MAAFARDVDSASHQNMRLGVPEFIAQVSVDNAQHFVQQGRRQAGRHLRQRQMGGGQRHAHRRR